MNEDTTPERRTRENELIRRLREGGPATSEELPRTPDTSERRFVGNLNVTRSNTGSGKSRGKTVAVYYLYGDERRAVRKYIQENTEFVASCMEDNANPINMSLEDYWWRMFTEEWTWGGYDDAVETETATA